MTLKLDLGRSELLESVRNFKMSLSGGSEAVFYFAGHGVQLGAANYLLPVDIVATNEEQVKDDGLPLQRVLDDITEQKARFSLAIVDACRDNPFPRVAGRSIGNTRGLAPTTAASGQMVIYSAGAGQTALDRLNNADRDPNGLFTRLFLREMLQPVSVDRVLRNVRDQVAAISGTWREIYPNPGNLTLTTQQRNTFQSVGRGMVLGKLIQVSGSWTIRGRTLESTYQSSTPSRGRCIGTVSADGKQVTSTCTDSVFGQFESSAVRQ